MTDEEKISLLALMISDIPGNPYYPIFTEDQYLQFLKLSKGKVEKAVVYAAISACMIIGSSYTREVIGDLQLTNNSGANYMKALELLIKNNGTSLPDGLMPWSASVPSYNKLLDFARCDCDDPRRRRPPLSNEYEKWVRDLDKDVYNLNTTTETIRVDLDDVSSKVESLIDSSTETSLTLSQAVTDISDLKDSDTRLTLEDLYRGDNS